jgi:Family of unknown function (DUF6502)
MQPKRRALARSRPRGGRISHSREFLERLARILVHTGHSPRALAREFRDVCSELKEPVREWDPAQLVYLWDLPHVISHWYSDPQYIDASGKPIPLPLRARGPSLSALIARVLPDEDPVAVTDSLMKLLGVKRKGALYRPSGGYVPYPRVSARVHGFTALLGMLRTVEHNVSARRKSPPLLERTALNPSFPVSELPVFYRRLKKEANRILWRMDEQMRHKEAAHRGGARVRLGIGIFTFEEPISARAAARRRTRRRKV